MSSSSNKLSLSCCPKCGCDEYVIRVRISGVIEEAHRYDGGLADNTEMWNSAILKPQKVARCRDCGKRIPSKMLDPSDR